MSAPATIQTSATPTAPTSTTRGRRRSHRTRGVGLGEAAWALALLWLGTAALAQGWAGLPGLVVLLVAGLVALALVLAVLRAGVSAAATVVVLTLLTVLGAYLASSSTGESMRDTLVDAVPRLLTAAVPAPPTPDLLAPGVVLVVLTALAVGLRLTRARQLRVAPVVGALLLYAGGLLLTAGRADRYGVLGTLILIAAVAGWATQPTAAATSSPARTDERSAVPARLRAIVPVVLVMTALALAAAVPRSADATDPRTLVRPPVTEVVAPSPLPQLAAWAREPSTVLFSTSGASTYLHLVVLPDFDGAAWSAGTQYRPLGAIGDAVLPPGPVRSKQTVRVRISDLDGPWVPAPGVPVAFSSSDLRLDPETGSTVLPDRRADVGSYTVTGEVDRPTSAALAGAAVPDDDTAARYLAVPKLPYRLADYARAVTRQARTPVAAAVAIQGAVRGSRTVTATSPSGSSYARISTFLFGRSGTPGAQTGTSEQFAVAFAILARASGLPTRIVVGFRPGTPAAGGSRVVRTGDALAWPEVYFDGAGWVPFSPTPATNSIGPDVQDSPPPSAPPSQQPSAQSSASPSGSATVTATAVPGGTPRKTDNGGAPVWAVAGISVLAMLVLLLVVLLAARRVRTLRHRRSGARGAWSELVDACRLAGVSVSRTVPAPDLAERLDEPVAAGNRSLGPAGRVAAAAEAEAYGPGRQAGATGNDRLWADVSAAVGSARQKSSRWRRVVWPVDPRPYWPDRGRRRH